MHWTRVLTLCFSLAQPRPHMHVRGRARKVLTSGTRVGRGGCSLQLAPAHATYMSPTSRSQCTVGMLSIGRVVGGGKEGAFRHSWQRGWLAAWLRHPRKNRSRSSATPARLSLLGGQLRMLMRRGNVSIVAMTHLALVSQSVSERLGQCTINTANTDSQDLVERTTRGNRSGARTTRGCALGSRIACLSWAQWKHDAPGSCHTHARNLKRSVYCGVRREK